MLRMAGFHENLVAGLVLWGRDGEEFVIDTQDAIWKGEDRHDGTIFA
jgi:hypothetical protein